MREDIQLIYEASRNLAAYYLLTRKFSKAEVYTTALVHIATRSCESDPHEPEYQRMLAGAHEQSALASAGLDRKSDALQHFAEAVRLWSALHKELPNDDRKSDYAEALERACENAQRWKRSRNQQARLWRVERKALEAGKATNPRPGRPAARSERK